MPYFADKPRMLSRLLADWAAAVAGTALPEPPTYEGPDLLVTSLSENGSDVTAGGAFIARVRATSDGHRYIDQAIGNGAKLIIGQHPPPAGLPSDVVYLQVADSALAAAWLAAAWCGFPSRRLIVIGVTGTDGKTTTANILFHLLRSAGYRTGMLSTVRAALEDVDEPLALHVTTPEAPVVQQYLRRMVDGGITHCVLESTSHGLAQQRVAAVDFDIAVVTNITHEHLDYHGDYEGYFNAKARLFHALNSSAADAVAFSFTSAKAAAERTAVLNVDDDSYEGLAAIGAPHQLRYGIDKPADVSATSVQTGGERTRFMLHLPRRPAFSVTSGLIGYFNVYNMLAAAGAAYSLGISGHTIQHSLATMPGITGRMERVDIGQPFMTVVDFAHTPDGLRQALLTGRRILASQNEPGKLIAVFGSAGKRDVAKRRLMAETAAELADLTVLTAEDPRTESLTAILAMMAAGCESRGGREGVDYWRVPDRGQAIRFALGLAAAGDLVLICGKAHEQSMCFGTTEYPWDDLVATRRALEAWRADAPMPDMGLPTFDPHWPGTANML